MRKYNVLLTGNIDAGVWTVADCLEDGRCNVTVAGEDIAPKDKKYNNRYFDLASDETRLSAIYKSGKFDTVVYFLSAKSESAQYDISGESKLGKYADDFICHIGFVTAHTEISQLILVTDQSVFGEEQKKAETTIPDPESFESNLMLIAENELDHIKRKEGALKKLLVRVPHLYNPGPVSGFAKDFSAPLTADRSTLYLPGTPDKQCQLLSTEDFGKFLLLAITEQSQGIMHTKGPESVSYHELKKFFEQYDYSVVYMGKDNRQLCLEGTRARKELGFVAGGNFREDLYLNEEKTAIQKHTDRLKYIRKALSKLLPWIETGIGAVLMELLCRLTAQNTVTAFIDVRLLFAVIIGSAHGVFFGWLAGVIAYISFAAAYLFNGGQIWDLLLNLDNWLPFVLYILAGGITGYLKTTHDDKRQELLEEKERVEGELSYLQEVHQHTCDMRDMLMEQVVKSRDSYGKIYNMVNELNSVYPDEILFRALRIFEDVLSNRTVSIYIRENGTRFLRKLVESETTGNTANSMNLNNYPELIEYIDRRELWVNKSFDGNYPAYCLTMRYDENKEFVIILWNAEPNQYSKYYENLLIIVSRLTCMALVKAVEFNELPDRYVGNTKFLKQEEFVHSWLTRRQMKSEKVGSYVIFRFSASLPDDVLSERFSRVVRSLDIAGKMDDGTRYILMMQASEKDADVILKRLENAGIAAYVTNEKALARYLDN